MMPLLSTLTVSVSGLGGVYIGGELVQCILGCIVHAAATGHSLVRETAFHLGDAGEPIKQICKERSRTLDVLFWLVLCQQAFSIPLFLT